jgi:hypothetical protein
VSKIKLSMDTTFDRIFSFYINGSVLSDTEEEIRKRWQAIYALILDFRTTKEIISIIEAKFDISQAQVYRDMVNVRRLFGDVNKSSKEGERNIIYELAKVAVSLARHSNPVNVKELNKAIKNMIDIQALTKETADIPAFEDLKPHVYLIAYDPKLLGIPETEDLDKLRAQFQKKKAKQIIDIDERTGDQTTSL